MNLKVNLRNIQSCYLLNRCEVKKNLKRIDLLKIYFRRMKKCMILG